MSEKIIFHIDVNNAFLSWEAVERLMNSTDGVDLRDIPSAVGGDIKKRRGVILAKSIPAKKYNVMTGEPVVNALKKCPDLVLVSPNHAMYKKKSNEFIEILRKYSDCLEQYSIDEAFMDMTGTALLFGEPIEAAKLIKDDIYNNLGFTVNVGISSNKLLAKMASDFEKPNKIHTLFPDEIEEKMWGLPVRELFLVGKSSEQKLRSLGINTIGDLAKSDRNVVKGLLKKHGEAIWDFANGYDVSIVTSEPSTNKCYGNSTTIAFDVTDEEVAKNVLLSLAETVGGRLRKDMVKIEVVSVTIRYSDFTKVSHQCVLDSATNITEEIYNTACRLFDEFWNGSPIRLLGIQTDHVVSKDTGRQLSLFDTTDYAKLEKLDAAVDSVKAKFGKDAICRAVFLDKK